ncbi:MAG: glycogen/starch/alpha-glucan phosphorylase, partial [Elainellaceae cyanobacterium]
TTSRTNIQVEDDRTGLSIETLRRALADNLFYVQGKFPEVATPNDFYMALAYTVRDRLLNRWLHTIETYLYEDVRLVAYLSAEFLPGPHLENNLINLGLYNQIKQAVEDAGLNFHELVEQEEEPGLGNGGLGRLAACYMDSLATLEIPAVGYGILYEFGIFDQEIRDGWQVEITDKWLQYGNPWEVARPEGSVKVGFGGYTEPYTDDQGRYQIRWVPAQSVKGIPYDTPVLGYRVNTANTLRLWKSEASESFDFQAFNVGDYYGAVNQKIIAENISKVLYPNDEPIQGRELRLQQQFFFVSCSLQDMIRIHFRRGYGIESFHRKFAVQLNDTHPAIGIAELMRLLLDEQHIGWDQAWHITRNTFAYTNHTLLAEALERWPIELLHALLPRHLEIIFEINQRFLNHVRLLGRDDGALERLSLIDEGGERYLRMANLACVGSHAINGVAALHTKLLKSTVLKDFYELFPERFTNKTNGVTPRRWIVQSNPRLTQLITGKIGDRWINSLDELQQLALLAEDGPFRQDWRQIKLAVKQDLAAYIHANTGVAVDPTSLFDIQVKRIHEYKRQHLNVLHIITLYNRIKANPTIQIQPRTFIFGGKAAPGYVMAKLVIKFIAAVGEVVNNDPDVGDRLKVVFLPNYNVSLGQRVYPAADLSEQISTAGKEASGTGNMKFAMNGALTIGTLDGANIEIRDAVGADNFFSFGLQVEEVAMLKSRGYSPWAYYQDNKALRMALDQVQSGYFSHGDSELFRPLIANLLHDDPFMVLADYQAYVDCQDRVGVAYGDAENWSRMSIWNVAHMGRFSSDRAIREYAEEIWRVQPVPIAPQSYLQSHAALKV